MSAITELTRKVLSRTGIFERTVLNGDVKKIDEVAFYTAYGDLFVYLCAASFCSLATYIDTEEKKIMLEGIRETLIDLRKRIGHLGECL